MTGIRWGIYVSVVMLLSILSGIGSEASADEELQIGIPDYPRRIKRELPPLPADREISLGILKVHPMFHTKVEYDDNIRLSNNNDREDVIFTQAPGIGAEMKFGDHRLEGAYGAEIRNFAKDSEENAVDHLAHALLEFDFDELTVQIQDSFEKSTGRLFSETSARDRVLINSVEVAGRYDRPKWAAEVGWRHNTVLHSIPPLERNDLDEDMLAFLAGYKILPKTLLLIETDIGWIYYERPDTNADQDYWQILAGLQGEPTEKITLTALIGFQDRQLGDVRGQGPQNDFDGVVVESDVRYRLSDNDIYRFGYNRSVRHSTFSDNSWYRQDKMFTSYSKRFFGKWVATPRLGWQFNDYPEAATIGGATKRRDDHYWIASFELRYEIQEWLSAEAAYRFRGRDSNFETLDFESNRFSFGINFAY